MVLSYQAPTLGFEPDVGARTTLRLLNKKWTHVYGSHHPDLILADYFSRKNHELVVSRCNVAEFKKVCLVCLY